MALLMSLVPKGLLHAVSSGSIDVGPGYGQVPAVGPNQLLKLLLPFQRDVIDKEGYEDQTYILAQSQSVNILSPFSLDPIQFEIDPVTKQSVLRLRVSLAAAPAEALIWVEAHHSAGR